MRLKNIRIILVLVACTFLFVSCSHDTTKSSWDELGGVFQINEEDLDLSVEISGNLSEEVPWEPVFQYNQLRAWGISRKGSGQIPDPDPGTPELLKKYQGFFMGDPTKKEIYLTFDEGYENGYTGKILDVLRDNQVTAVFFITGPYLKNHMDLVRRMVEEGHIVGNHTVGHPSLPSLNDHELEEEILGLDRAFYEKFGKNMKYLRPPKGEYSERTLELTSKLGYRNMFWSFAYDDWYRDKVRGADYAYQIVMRNLHNGEILLLHAVSKDNAEALDSIIKDAKKAGYVIGNVENIE